MTAGRTLHSARALFALGAFLLPAAAGAQAPIFITKWSGASASGVAVDAAGNVYAVEETYHRVQKFTGNGALLARWGSQGSGNGQFSYPYDIAVDASGNVYVTDQGNDRVQKFTGNGAYLTQWGGLVGPGGLPGPTGIAVDAGGNVYVADHAYRIQRFTSSGVYLAKWGTYGTGNGQMGVPFGVAADRNGNVYVADPANYRIQKFTSGGAFQAKWAMPDGEQPYGLDVDAFGNVYVTERYHHHVNAFTGGGILLGRWGGYGSADGQFSFPFDLALAADGSVYVADNGNYRIQKFGMVPTPAMSMSWGRLKSLYR